MDVETYIRAINEYLPDVEIRGVAPIEGGWVSDVLDVNGELIFKFPKSEWGAEMNQKERSLLAELSGSISVPVPDYRYDCQVDGYDFKRFVGYPKIEGERLSRAHLRPPRDESVARQLGVFLSELHAFPVRKAVAAGLPQYDPTAWRERYQVDYQWLLENAFSRLNTSGKARMQRHWETFLDEPAHFRFTPVLTHGDVKCDHIFIDSERSAIAGVIDWGQSAVQDPCVDFGRLRAELGHDFVQLVVDRYGGSMDDTFWNRVEFYSLMGPYILMRQGIEIGEPSFLQSGLQEINKGRTT